MTCSINSVLLDEVKYLPRREGISDFKRLVLLALMTVDLKSAREDEVLHIAT